MFIKRIVFINISTIDIKVKTDVCPLHNYMTVYFLHKVATVNTTYTIFNIIKISGALKHHIWQMIIKKLMVWRLSLLGVNKWIRYMDACKKKIT